MRWVLVSVCCLAAVCSAFGSGGLPRDASLEASLGHVRSVLDGLKERRRGDAGEGLLGTAQAIDALGRAQEEWLQQRFQSHGDSSVSFNSDSLWAWLGTGVRCAGMRMTENEYRATARHTRRVMAEAAEVGWVDEALSLLVDGRRVEATGDEFPRVASGARRLRTLLIAEAIDRYERGETEAAVRVHGALVALAEHSLMYGDAVSDMSARSIFEDASRLVWEAIDRGVLSGEAAEALLRVFDVEPDWAGMRRGSLVWHVESVEVVQRVVGLFGEDGAVRPELAAQAPSAYSMGITGITLPRLGEGERYATAAEIVAAIERWSAALGDEAAKPRAARDPDRLALELDAGVGVRVPGGFLPELRVMHHTFTYTDNAEFAVGAARLALAIEVYRHRQGRLPERLDDLVPGVLEGLPRDPWAEEGRYRYRVTDASHLGYVLYGVGLNGEDNGGVQLDVCLDVPSHFSLKWDGAVDCVVLPRRRMEGER